MACHTFSLAALVSIVALSALISPSSAVETTPTEYVNCHNTPRGLVGVGNVAWNATLATYALNYANTRKADCAMTHSSGPYGENLAKGNSGSFTGISAVNMWVAEKQDYDYDSNSCTVGKECKHYTQVVWSDSTQIGCARVQCNDGWYYVVCSYHQPGNWAGEWPY